MAALLAPGGCFCLVSHNAPERPGRSPSGLGPALSCRPDWLQAVIRGLGACDAAGCPPKRWLLELHKPAAGAGPTVYLFRNVRRPARGGDGGGSGGEALEISHHKYSC